jgi:hypothetical protein
VLVRTGGRWGGSRSSAGAGDARSWLLIKHADDWAGPIDITEFAPRSVKSDGDFEDILASDNPDIWESHRPAQGGDTGAMFKKIIERAVALKSGSRLPAAGSRGPASGARLPAAGTKKTGAKRSRASLKNAGSRNSAAGSRKPKAGSRTSKASSKAGAKKR